MVVAALQSADNPCCAGVFLVVRGWLLEFEFCGMPVEMEEEESPLAIDDERLLVPCEPVVRVTAIGAVGKGAVHVGSGRVELVVAACAIDVLTGVILDTAWEGLSILAGAGG